MAQMHNGVFVAMLPAEREGEIELRVRGLRRKVDRAPAGDLRQVETVLADEDAAEAEKGVGVVRLERGRVAVLGDGVIAASEPLEHETEIVMVIRIVAIDGNGPLHQLDGSIAAADLVSEDAEAMQGIVVVGVDGENAPVERLGLRQLAGEVMGTRGREELRNGPTLRRNLRPTQR